MADFVVIVSVWTGRGNPPCTAGCGAGILFFEFCGVS